MLFRLINASQQKHSHAGVLEFVAEEGRAYFPQWVSMELKQYLTGLYSNNKYFITDDGNSRIRAWRSD